MFINSQTRPLHASEGDETRRKAQVRSWGRGVSPVEAVTPSDSLPREGVWGDEAGGGGGQRGEVFPVQEAAPEPLAQVRWADRQDRVDRQDRAALLAPPPPTLGMQEGGSNWQTGQTKELLWQTTRLQGGARASQGHPHVVRPWVEWGEEGGGDRGPSRGTGSISPPPFDPARGGGRGEASPEQQALPPPTLRGAPPASPPPVDPSHLGGVRASQGHPQDPHVVRPWVEWGGGGGGRGTGSASPPPFDPPPPPTLRGARTLYVLAPPASPPPFDPSRFESPSLPPRVLSSEERGVQP